MGYFADLIIYSRRSNRYNIPIAGRDTDAREGVMRLTARERVLMIRLMEKLEKHPTYATLLGIEATDLEDDQNMKSDPKGLTSM